MFAETTIIKESAVPVKDNDDAKPLELLFCGLIGIWGVLGLWFSSSLLFVFLK